MRFIQGYALKHFLSPVDTSSDSLRIYLPLFSAALLGVGRQGGFSSHIFYTHLLVQMAYSRWVVLFLNVYSNTLAFCQKLEDSALLLRVPLSIFYVQHFLEETLKLPENFLSLSIPCELLRSFSLAWYMEHLVILCSFGGVSVYLRSSLEGLFGLLVALKGSLFYRCSGILGGTTPRLWAMSWEVLYLTYCFVVQRRRFNLRMYYLIFDGITLIATFTLHSLDEERIK